jgi:hypothetical protein
LIPLDLGDTSFISALRRAIQLLREGDAFKEPRNRAIVIFTDGEPDDPRKLTLQQYFGELKGFIEREATPQQVHLFIVGIDAAGRRWSATAPSWRQLVGHEQVFTTPSMEALKEHFNRIVQRIWHLPEVRPVVVASQSPVEFAVEPYLAAVEFHIFPGSQGLSLRISRPNGTVVKPGQEPHTPPVKHLATSDKIVVYEPEPGQWRYEVVGGAGTVEVLRNPIPLRMRLISPAPLHPQGKPMRLIAEFKRTDGKPVQAHADYPLGLAAEVQTPTGQSTPVKLPLEQGRDGVFTGEPDIADTMAPGEYRITLKVSGGDKFQSKYPAVIQVQPVPYLQVQQPTTKATLTLAAAIRVQAQLLQAGQPLRSQEAFSNHPDYLVMAQVTRVTDGKRAKREWLPQVKGATTIGQFAGEVPLPEVQPGAYTLAVQLAPEEDAKKARADQTIIEFVMLKAPWPLWVRVVLWILVAVLLLTLITFVARRVRRWYVARLRLPFYYWVEDQATWRVLVFEGANEAKNLPEVPLGLQRIGKEPRVRVASGAGAQLLTGDGRVTSALETHEGGRILVQTADGTTKAVTFNLHNPPPRPEPSERPTSLDEGAEAGPPHEEETDWGFGKTTE